MDLDGIILINKEKGCTSHDIVNKIKYIFNEKVGHTGTLDPNATGLLPILIGKGTKLSYYLTNHNKEYEVTLKLGVKTDTADSEGKIVEEEDLDKYILQENEVEQVLKSFIGKQMQIPPIYSAIKVNGKKLYEYARNNINVEIKAREIEIYNIKLNKIDNKEKEIFFIVECSKGTYIRSLCEDIATKLNTIGYMKELNRTKVGIFNIKDSIKLEELVQNKNNEKFMQENILSIEKLFMKLYGNNNKIVLDEKKIKLFFNGVQLTYNLKNGQYRIYDETGKFIGVATVKDKLLKRKIVI